MSSQVCCGISWMGVEEDSKVGGYVTKYVIQSQCQVSKRGELEMRHAQIEQ